MEDINSPHKLKIVRIYATEDGESHIDKDYYINIDKPHSLGTLSENFNVRDLVFRRTPASYDLSYHCAPCRQFIVCLDAGVQCTTSDGDTVIVNAGEILLMEDVTGKGHLSKAVDGKPRTSIFIPIVDKN
eukprot:TRINITY_DN4974_c0_g1_i1.p1 TRINITY_DN4974_c0_g1~~TRINITY_DN4974_c0_g1_i1.p1  ORF type:complete len:137 (+),score=23.69 TRINITY_DN4974_c0_g1_i1:22-411(+)